MNKMRYRKKIKFNASVSNLSIPISEANRSFKVRFLKTLNVGI